MAKTTEDTDLSVLAAGALAMRNYQRELERSLEKANVGDGEAAQLHGFPAYTILVFLAEYDAAEMTEKKHLGLLKKFNVDTPGNLKTYPLLSQSALFEIFGNLGLSRESIRRLLIQLSAAGLIDRTSKGPPFPDKLGISKEGGRLVKRVSRRLVKDMAKARPFAYL